MGLPGVKLDAASVAPPQGGCCSSTRHLGGNVYLPREWAFGITPGEQPVPLRGTPFHAFMSRTRIGVSGTGIREVPGRPQAWLLGARRPGTGKPSAGTGRGSRAKVQLPLWTLMRISRQSESIRAQRTGSGRHLGGRGFIMEGPLVSDTTELLSDAAAPAPGETLTGQSAVGPEGTVAAASRPQGRPVGDLSKLLVPDLQKIAQQLGIPGAGRMRKGQLVAAIEEHQIGGRPSSASQQSATRGAPAGVGAPRPLNQDAMEAGTTVRPGIGDAVQAGGIGDAPAVSSVAASTGHAGIGEQAASAAPVSTASAASQSSVPPGDDTARRDNGAQAPAGDSHEGDAQGSDFQGGDVQADAQGDGQGPG